MPAVLNPTAPKAPAPAASTEPLKPKAASQGNYLMLAIPIMPELPTSKSGGSRLLAQVQGFTKLELTYNGLPIQMSGVSVIVPLPGKTFK